MNSRPRRQPLGARLTTAWSRAYTYRLPVDVAASRRDEIAADLHDQLADAGPVRTTVVSRDIAVRMLLGVAADLSWRSQQLRAHRSVRRKDIVMNASGAASQRTLALTLGGLLVAWGVIMTVGSSVDQIRAGGDQGVVWFLFAAAALVGVAGLILLVRRSPAGGVLLAIAAIGTTAPFFWMPPIWMAGIGLAVFFGLFARRQLGAGRLPLSGPVA